MDFVIHESYSKGIILRRNYMKMTIYNHFFKFHGKNNCELQHDHVRSRSVQDGGVL